MHAMQLRVESPAAGARERRRAEPCHWSEGRHYNDGVSLWEMRATTQIMLGVLLRARWDATLVFIMFRCAHIANDCNVVIVLVVIFYFLIRLEESALLMFLKLLFLFSYLGVVPL